jgi:hypothetical protein
MLIVNVIAKRITTLWETQFPLHVKDDGTVRALNKVMAFFVSTVSFPEYTSLNHQD